jgi:hypothetical protein
VPIAAASWRRLSVIYPRVVSLLIAAAGRKVPAGSQRD